MNSSTTTMSIITPNTIPKLRITMPSDFAIKGAEAPVIYTKRPFNEYTLFLILEQERNLKLKEIYRKRSIDRDDPSGNDDGELPDLPNFPPRYHNFHYSAEWFISKLNHPRRPLPTKASAQLWKSLDQMTLSFLQDVASILYARYNENYETECHTPIDMPAARRSMTVTPVPSPLRKPADGLEALLLASQVAFPPLPSLEDTNETPSQAPAWQGFHISNRDVETSNS